MIIPDRVMQTQGFVTVAPAVSRSGVLLDDNGRHPQLPQPRAQGDTALPTADYQHFGLLQGAQVARLGVTLLGPGRSMLVRTVLCAKRSIAPQGFLVAL